MKPTVSIYQTNCNILYKSKTGKPVDWLILYA